MAKAPEILEELSDEEIAKRRDETLKRMLSTPPTPHSETAGKKERKPKDETKRRR